MAVEEFNYVKTEEAFRRIFELRENFIDKFKDKAYQEMSWADLHECRQNLKRTAKAFLDKVQKEKRQCTEEEDQAWFGMQARLDLVNGEFENREKRKMIERDLEEKRAGRSGGNGGGQGGSGTGPIFEDKHGNEVRSLRAQDSIALRSYPDLPEGIQAEELSMGRFFRGIVTGDWTGAEAERRTMGGNSDVLGGFIVPSPLAARVIDLARNQSRVMQAGALTVPMDSSTLKLGRVLSDPTAHWRHENTPGTFSDMSFGLLTLSARTLVSMCKISLELVEDASNIDALVQSAMASALALELDRAALRGQGAGAEPLGIRNWEGIQTVDLGQNGGFLQGYDNFSLAWEKIQGANGPSEGLSAIYAPKTAGYLDRMKDGNGLPLDPPASWKSFKKFATNQVRTDLTKGNTSNTSEAFVGDFSQLLMGMRRGITIDVSRDASDSSGSAFKDLQVWVRIYLRADVALARPDHFVLIDGIKYA